MVGWQRWAAAAALLALAGAAAAEGPEQAVIDQLSRQGYVEFEVSRTLLGRIRVVATGLGGERREIVFNPATGEILRDLLAGSGLPQVLDRPAVEAPPAPGEDAVVARAPGPADGVGTAAAAAATAIEGPEDATAAAASSTAVAGEAPDPEDDEPDEPDEGDEGDRDRTREEAGDRSPRPRAGSADRE